MSIIERWVADLQGNLEQSGRIPPGSGSSLADAARASGGPGCAPSCLLLGLAQEGVPIHDALGYLARAWDAGAPLAAQSFNIRRAAARHLFSAGFSEDALSTLQCACDGHEWHPTLDLSCRALRCAIQLDLGQICGVAAEVEAILDRFIELSGRFQRNDRLWLAVDLIQSCLAMVWRSTEAGLALGSRIPEVDTVIRDQALACLSRLLNLPEVTARDALPRLKILCLLSEQTIGRGAKTSLVARLTELIVGYDQCGPAAEGWSLLGFGCRLAGLDDRAIACHRRALTWADETDERRAAALSSAELATLLAARMDHKGAYAAMCALRADEQRLWAESSLPLGRRWFRSTGATGPLDGPSNVEGHGMASLHVGRARKFIEQNLGTRFSTADLAKACGVSRRTIEQAFRAALGCTVKEHIRSARVAVVRHRLLKTTDPVKRIALDLGYPSGAAMGRDFKLVTGQTLSSYRRSLVG